MKKQLSTQLQKFEARAAKAASNQAIDNKAIEAQIAEEMAEKKSLYSVIGVLERSVRHLVTEVQSLRHENDLLQAIRQENQEMKGLFSKILTEVEEIRKVTVGSLYLDDKGKLDAGMIFHKTPLQRHRAQQIKEKGFFVDPTDPEILSGLGIIVDSSDVVVEEAVDIPVVSTHVSTSVPAIKISNGKRGRIPNHIRRAYELVATHTLESGRYRWREGGAKLIYAILAIGEWKDEVNVYSAGAIQKNADTRKAFQQVTYNKEKYGVASWAVFMEKFEEAKKDGNA